MGCTLSTLPKSPGKGHKGQWTDEGPKQTLVDKWITFREWVRKHRGKKTKVVPVSIKPPKARNGDAAGESEDPPKSPQNESWEEQYRRQYRQSMLNVAQWLLHHENAIETKSYSPLPGVPTGNTRPKAAKGKRTLLPPLEEPLNLPGAVMTDEDRYDGYDASRRHSGDDGMYNETCPKNVRDKELIMDDKSQSKAPQNCLDVWMKRKLEQD